MLEEKVVEKNALLSLYPTHFSLSLTAFKIIKRDLYAVSSHEL
jgi:hypothetical protein